MNASEPSRRSRFRHVCSGSAALKKAAICLGIIVDRLLGCTMLEVNGAEDENQVADGQISCNGQCSQSGFRALQIRRP